MSNGKGRADLNGIDDLCQLRDELHVIWCALTNPNHGEECVIPIAEHVHGIRLRLGKIVERLQGGGA